MDFSGKQVQVVFNNINVPINHLQIATAALAYENHVKESAQIWCVPAGQGKSKIHAALTFLFLEKTDYDIFVIFSNDTLLEIDK